MINKEKAKLGGHLKITEICQLTGKEMVVFDDKNVVTDAGFATFFQRATQNTGGSYLYNIVLGDDYGSGDLLNPEPASASYTQADQNDVYEIPNSDITFTYPTTNVVRLETTLDGTYIMDTFYPSETELQYTSATTRFQNGSVFSYKRFPVRSISRLVSIQIVWTITINEV